jgi:hypothetical protein
VTVEQPLLRVVRGTPDEVAVAALAVVVSAIAAAARAAAGAEHRPHWSVPKAMLRRPIGHGPGAWRASGLPG